MIRNYHLCYIRNNSFNIFNLFNSYYGVVCFFIGQKQASGTFAERAGLVNGKNYCLQVEGLEVD
jgi:hypothetical protein